MVARSLRRQFLLSSTMLVSTLTGYVNRAYGQCAYSGPGQYLCSNANTTTQSIFGSDLDVSTAPGFSVTTIFGHAIEITGDGALSYTDDNNSSLVSTRETALYIRSYGDETDPPYTPGSITINTNGNLYGYYDGIDARNYGSGGLDITATGNVTAGYYAAIHARNSSSGTHLSITTGPGAITGGFGIDARNYGNGALTIDANGPVTGLFDGGILAYNASSSSTTLDVTTGDVTGYNEAIFAIHNGTGALSIAVNGDVQTLNPYGFGVVARNTSTATGDLTITTAAGTTVNAGQIGVRAENYGSGALIIEAGGDVVATYHTANGIHARNQYGSSTDLSITAAGVSGGYNGIYARNSGSGVLTVTADGDVTGANYTGIYARNDGTDLSVTTGTDATVTGGGSSGIVALNDGSGRLTVTAGGDVTGTVYYGILAQNQGSDLSVTTEAGTVITGGFSGIEARNFGSGALDIATVGDVTGLSGYGIRARNYGATLTVTTGAGTSVSGDTIGIHARNYGTDLIVVTGAGSTVTGNGDAGIVALNEGSGLLAVTAGGDVTGAVYYGILAQNQGSDLSVTTEAGSNVVGGFSGIEARNFGSGALTVSADGDVTGLSGHGIRARGFGTDLAVTTGTDSTIFGDTTGIWAHNYGSGALTVSADGDVTGGTTGVYAYNNGDGALTITTNGTVSGTDFGGIFAYNSSYASSTLSIVSNGEVTGLHQGIEALHNGAGALSIVANGDVRATNGVSTGISAFLGSYVTGDATILTAAGTTVSGGSRGISVNNNGLGALLIEAGGDVHGTGPNSHGIYARNSNVGSTDLMVIGADVSGSITGINVLSYGTGVVTVVANGAVSSSTSHGIYARNANGTDLSIAGTDVSGGHHGIYGSNAGSGALTVSASGDVAGNAGNGVHARNSGTDLVVTTGAGIAVSGGITGINARNNGTGALTVTAEGDVTGTGNTGIYTRNLGTDLIVTTGEGVALSGGDFGLVTINDGTGELTVTSNGDISGSNFYGIFAQNSGTDLTITAGMGGAITGGYDGIEARGFGSGALTITVDGAVSGINRHGIFARNFGTDLVVSTADGTSVTGNTHGIRAQNSGSGTVDIDIAAGSTVTSTGSGYAIDISGSESSVTVAGTLNGGAGGAIRFDDFENRLELQTGAVINGDIIGGAGNDTLVLEGAGGGSLDIGQVRNFEFGIKADSGDWVLTGTNNDAMEFIVNGGHLTMNGSMAFTDFTVTGGTLSGTGMFGGLTVAAGSAIAPGNSIGTINVVDITFDPGSIFEVEVNAAGQSDRIEASGIATLNGGTVQVVPFPDFAINTPYTILTAAGGVIGTFDDVAFMFGSMFLMPELLYGADAVSLILNQTAFADVAATRNQRAAAAGADPLGMGNTVYEAIVALGSADEAQAAFDSLSGEIHASLGGILADQSRHMRGAVLGRLMQASGGGASEGQAFAALAANEPQIVPSAHSNAPVFWMRGFGARAEFDTDGNAASTDRKLNGFVMGVDRQIAEGWRAGLAAGFTETDIHTSARASSANVDTYHLAAYAGGTFGGFRFSGGASFARHEIDTNRTVAFPGFTEQVNASYTAHAGQVFGEAAYPLAVGSLDLEPFAGLAYVHFDADAFRESGGASALEGSANKEDVGYFTLGQRASATTQWGNTRLTAHASAAWQHAFGDTTPDANLSLAGGDAFNVAGVPHARDSALLAAGLDLGLGSSASLGISWTGQFSGSAKDHGIELGLSWQF